VLKKGERLEICCMAGNEHTKRTGESDGDPHSPQLAFMVGCRKDKRPWNVARMVGLFWRYGMKYNVDIQAEFGCTVLGQVEARDRPDAFRTAITLAYKSQECASFEPDFVTVHCYEVKPKPAPVDGQSPLF